MTPNQNQKIARFVGKIDMIAENLSFILYLFLDNELNNHKLVVCAIVFHVRNVLLFYQLNKEELNMVSL